MMVVGLCILNHEGTKDRKEKLCRSFNLHQAGNPTHDLAKTITMKPKINYFAAFAVQSLL